MVCAYCGLPINGSLRRRKGHPECVRHAAHERYRTKQGRLPAVPRAGEESAEVIEAKFQLALRRIQQQRRSA